MQTLMCSHALGGEGAKVKVSFRKVNAYGQPKGLYIKLFKYSKQEKQILFKSVNNIKSHIN